MKTGDPTHTKAKSYPIQYATMEFNETANRTMFQILQINNFIIVKKTYLCNVVQCLINCNLQFYNAGI